MMNNPVLLLNYDQNNQLIFFFIQQQQKVTRPLLFNDLCQNQWYPVTLDAICPTREQFFKLLNLGFCEALQNALFFSIQYSMSIYFLSNIFSLNLWYIMFVICLVFLSCFQGKIIELTSSKNSYLFKQLKPFYTELSHKGKCCNCTASFEYELIQQGKILQPKFSNILFSFDKFFVIFNENKLQLKSVQENYDNITLQNTKEIQISQKKYQKFFFFASEQQGTYFFLIGKKIYWLLIDNDNFKMVFLKKTKFMTKNVVQILEKNGVLIIMTNKKIHFYQIDSQQQELFFMNSFDENLIFPETFNPQEKSQFYFDYMKILKMKKKGKFIKYCQNQEKLKKSEKLKSEEKKIFLKNCSEIRNFCLQIIIKEPLTKNDFSQLKLCLKQIVQQKKLQKNKIKLFSKFHKFNFQVGEIDFHLSLQNNHFYYYWNNEHTYLSNDDGKIPKLVYKEEINGIIYLVFQTREDIIIHQVFILKNQKKHIVQKHKLKIRKLMPYQQVHKVNVNIYKSKKSKAQILVVNLSGRYFVYEIKNQGLKLKCNLLGAHYFNLTCKEHIQIQYLEGHQKNQKLPQYKTFDVTVKFIIYKFDKDKIIGFIFIFFLLYLIYLAMRGKNEKFYRRRYQKIKTKKD